MINNQFIAKSLGLGYFSEQAFESMHHDAKVITNKYLHNLPILFTLFKGSVGESQGIQWPAKFPNKVEGLHCFL